MEGSVSVRILSFDSGTEGVVGMRVGIAMSPYVSASQRLDELVEVGQLSGGGVSVADSHEVVIKQTMVDRTC